tara:strand:+ start:689 stop:910 length:222 start_codon:yes stop_codon:yes gene_type:complete
MAKYFLFIHFCSLVADNCMPPIEHSLRFADYYSCMITGYADSLQMYEQIEPLGINEWEITIGHECIKKQSDEI